MSAEYNHREIEPKWQKYWEENHLYRTDNDLEKPKFYALDMFPYPSGAGLHVGHPLGYIASDIVSRYMRLKGYNVLHPMGFDAFGLPAEQYAIDTGQHPAITTEKNIATFKKQMAKIGFSYDWSREVVTADPAYYRWTQWIFLQLFDSWYDQAAQKARPVSELLAHFAQHGNQGLQAACNDDTPAFTAAEWNSYDETTQANLLLQYRLTYLSEAMVNWCPALGTVLANDEVKDGFSERGGYPVERKKMRQWMMRITAYADRLDQNLDRLHWSEAMKDMQRNWIGKSYGCELDFQVAPPAAGDTPEGYPEKLTVFTTRPDTIYGVTYLVLAPEHDWVPLLTTDAQQADVTTYVDSAKNRSERERQADVKTVSGVFTGSYAINPFNQEKVPIWVADYVLAGYGTGVVMAVPSSDDRDYRFARHFNLPVVCVIEGTETMENPTDKKDGVLINSGLLNGLFGAKGSEGALKAIAHAEMHGFGKAKVNYRMRDAVFSRQRYWGEPVPVYFQNGIAYPIPEQCLPLTLPAIEQYKPTETGEPPLARATHWHWHPASGKVVANHTPDSYPIETTTMPGWAGSSWYFLRYMDPQNGQALADPQVSAYWGSVDLYIGGTEHATGHLLYSRFWNMFLSDRGFISQDEPFQKLVNQGMIQGRSSFVYKVKQQNTFVSYGLKDQYDVQELHVDVSLVQNDTLDIAAFKAWRTEYADSEFVLENGKYLCGSVVEKMSKSKYNVVNPDDIVEKYGADTLRMYEMFLGPLEQSKPWSTEGIEGVSKFLRKLWRLFYDEKGALQVTMENPKPEELKILHKTIKKVSWDIENLSFNTSIPALMVCVNELTTLKCHKAAILNDLLIVLSPFAPHFAEELWAKMGHVHSIVQARFPAWNEEYLKENNFEYPVSINGKVRTKLVFPVDAPVDLIQAETMASEAVQKWVEGKTPKKIIVVPNRIINIVV
jgi:leucyl-tRNA synthetase